mmetsp:Transcript_52199/g.117573  ORF Transcript_52199/g.117573 Transcript_52199/m.117573 type:complete len:224 (+) Transcript_52199:44-715(+)
MTESDDVFLTRHGSRIDKEDRNWLQKAGHRRDDDPHLSSAGEEQASQLAVKMAAIHAEDSLAHIVSSPFVRCVQTALPIAEALGLPIKIEAGICEILDRFPPKFLDTKELHDLYPLVDTTYESIVARSSLSVEFSDGQAARRAGRAALEARRRLKGRILFVGHGASCLGIAEAFGRSDYIGYASLSHFACNGEASGTWELVGTLGDVSHLSAKHQRTSLQSAF